MRIFTLTLVACLLVTVCSAQTRSNVMTQPSRDALEAAAELRSKSKAHMKLGQIDKALSALEEAFEVSRLFMLPWEMALLCFEKGDYEVMKQHLKTSDEIQVSHYWNKPDDRDMAYSDSFTIVALAIADGREADWSGMRTLNTEFTPQRMALLSAYAAITNFHFRTARIYIRELTLLGGDPLEIEHLQKKLSEYQEIQRQAIIEAAKAKGSGG